jgi:hypothetical protein
MIQFVDENGDIFVLLFRDKADVCWLRYGYLTRLPDDYTGERHVAITPLLGYFGSTALGESAER